MIEHFISAQESEDMGEDLDVIIELLRQPNTISSMPDDLLKQFFDMTVPGDFPEDIRELLFDEVIRRGLIPDE